MQYIPLALRMCCLQIISIFSVDLNRKYTYQIHMYCIISLSSDCIRRSPLFLPRPFHLLVLDSWKVAEMQGSKQTVLPWRLRMHRWSYSLLEGTGVPIDRSVKRVIHSETCKSGTGNRPNAMSPLHTRFLLAQAELGEVSCRRSPPPLWCLLSWLSLTRSYSTDFCTRLQRPLVCPPINESLEIRPPASGE